MAGLRGIGLVSCDSGDSGDSGAFLSGLLGCSLGVKAGSGGRGCAYKRLTPSPF